MSKTELIEKVAKQATLSKVDSGKAVNAVLDTIIESMEQKQDVALIGFGSFTVKRRMARTGRDPKTGKEIQINAKNVVRFRPGSVLKEAVN